LRVAKIAHFSPDPGGKTADYRKPATINAKEGKPVHHLQPDLKMALTSDNGTRVRATRLIFAKAAALVSGIHAARLRSEKSRIAQIAMFDAANRRPERQLHINRNCDRNKRAF